MAQVLSIFTEKSESSAKLIRTLCQMVFNKAFSVNKSKAKKLRIQASTRETMNTSIPRITSLKRRQHLELGANTYIYR